MRSSNVISYGLTLFFPLILPAIILVPGAGLSLTIPGGLTWPMVFILLSVTVVPIAVITGLYFLCSIFSLFGQRLMINYLGWLLLAGGGIYLCMGALGGASMAAVEGAVTASESRAAMQSEMLNLLLYGQAVIIPLCVWGTRRTSRLFQAPGNSSVVGA